MVFSFIFVKKNLLKTQFYKYHGTGNDFIMIDDRNSVFPISVAIIKSMCHRRFGIGADGLILLQKHETHDYRMRYFNSDGNESTMCGNGGRCITAFANHLNLIDSKAKFMASDGPHYSIINSSNGNDTWDISLKMTDIQAVKKVENGFFVDTGSPHFVLFVDNLPDFNVVENGRKIRYSKVFAPGGTNVNFVEKRAGQYHLRTYERGVEDETLSCGTGTIASAIAISIHYNLSTDFTELYAPGGKLSVRFRKNKNTFEDIWLQGAAQLVFKGETEL